MNVLDHDEELDEGFTLIELLVVIIIIGILAAIAIPVFLNQRQHGYDAVAKSDLRNAANFEEVYLTDTFSYGATSDLAAAGEAVKPSKGVTVTVLFNGSSGYCLSAKNGRSPRTFYYDSQSGGLQATNSAGCPVTISGTAGGSITG